MILLVAGCNDPDVLSIMIIVRTIINLLCLIGPIAAIFMMSLDIVKAVIAKDQDSITKKTKGIIPKLIAVAFIFLVPSIIDLTVGIVDEE